MIDLVVSRFNEDLAWTTQLPDFVNVIVYNKGTDSNFGSPLPNMGGSPHTFLHHIVSVYDKLNATNSDYILFVNGDPFKHFMPLLYFIEQGTYGKSDITLMSDVVLDCDMNGEPHHSGLPLGDFFDKALKMTPPENISFGAGGQFAIHKRLIHRKKFSHFAELYITVFTQPIVSYMLERTWQYVFK